MSLSASPRAGPCGLRIEKLTVGYGRAPVLEDFSLEVPAGHAVAVVGPNGAGKSTLLRAVSGLLRARSGKVLLGDDDVLNREADQVSALGLLHVPETRDIFSEMTVWENLKVAHDNLGFGEDEEAAFDGIYDLFPILKERRGQAASLLSGGQQQMLAIARALLGRPRVLMLDEPSLGLAKLVIRDIYTTLRKLRERGLTILLVEQNATMAIDFCELAYVVVNGRIVLSGTRSELSNHSDLVHHYLGGSTGKSTSLAS
ncbi:MAG: ABC transporter ATP-binding protein [Burkholderiaceae bacterium]|nr:ABC transporter ATP-binding protein [Burkholderiaceae bacterium]